MLWFTLFILQGAWDESLLILFIYVISSSEAENPSTRLRMFSESQFLDKQYMFLQFHSWSGKKKKKHNLKRYKHPNVHSGTIYNSHDVEAT